MNFEKQILEKRNSKMVKRNWRKKLEKRNCKNEFGKTKSEERHWKHEIGKTKLEKQNRKNEIRKTKLEK